MTLKFCKNCEHNKELNDNNFRLCKYKSGKTYFKSMCKRCESITQVNRIKKNGLSPKAKKTNIAWKKQWRNDNRELYNKRCRDTLKSRPEFRLRKNVSRAISFYIKKNDGNRNSSMMKHVSYTISELKIYLESQFDNKMNWDNYGDYWHIDHIIPQSCLPYLSMEENNFKKCWALENLRPLEAAINMSDGATRIRHKIFTGDNNE
jgi:hypothetical protein